MNQSDNVLTFLQTTQVRIDTDCLLELYDQHYAYLFVKNLSLQYKYANQSFAQLLGISSFNHLINKTNESFYTDKKLIKRYRECDEFVIEEQKSLTVCEPLAPKLNKNIHKVVQGKLFPIYSDANKITHVLGVVTPKSKLIKLDWETVFRLSLSELNDILVKRSYLILCQGYETTLSKMEIKTIVQLLKGHNAAEIALTLQIKQTTVESYLKNIRNKLSVSSKSELIHVLIRDNVLQQIVV